MPLMQKNVSVAKMFDIDLENLSIATNDSFGDVANRTVHYLCDEPTVDFFSSVYFQAIIYICYITIMVLSMLGNGIVCYLVHSAPRMRSVKYFFIVNLSVGDILMTIFCIPFSFLSVFTLRHWPFGELLCRTVSYTQALSVFVSAYTLVAISIDRYMAIMWPLRPRMTKSHAKIIIALVWLIAIFTALPIPIVSQVMQPANATWYTECDRYVCSEIWEKREHGMYYSIVLMTLQYCVPFFVLVYTYTMIAVVVWGKRTPGEAENGRDQRMAKSKRKMIKMMVTVVIVFTICWLPFNVISLVLGIKDIEKWSGLPYLWFLCHWLAMSHTCYNPVIYAYMNGRFRIGFISVLSKIPCMQHILPSSHTRGTSISGFAMTGVDATDSNSLQRANTCTTYISVKKKNGGPLAARSSVFIKNQAVNNHRACQQEKYVEDTI